MAIILITIGILVGVLDIWLFLAYNDTSWFLTFMTLVFIFVGTFNLLENNSEK